MYLPTTVRDVLFWHIKCRRIEAGLILLPEVELRLAKINIYKAPDPDGIPNWLLRDFSQILCYALAAIFNASHREGFFPLIWNSADVVAIPKVDPPTSIQNDLRPISLLPTVATVACPTLMSYLSLNGITNQDPLFRTFANQPPVFTISFHLREIPL